MSFAFETKRELCAAQDAALSHKRAEAYGYLLFAKNFQRTVLYSARKIPMSQTVLLNCLRRYGR